MVSLLGPAVAQFVGPVIIALGALAAAVAIFFVGHRAGKTAAVAAASKQVEATDTAVIVRQTAMAQAQADAPRDVTAEIEILKAGKL